MEYLHSGTLEVSSSVLPGLLCATQHFDVADLRQTCLDQSEQFITQHTVSLIPALFWSRVLQPPINLSLVIPALYEEMGSWYGAGIMFNCTANFLKFSRSTIHSLLLRCSLGSSCNLSFVHWGGKIVWRGLCDKPKECLRMRLTNSGRKGINIK